MAAYGVSVTTLEEVFLRVDEEAKETAKRRASIDLLAGADKRILLSPTTEKKVSVK